MAQNMLVDGTWTEDFEPYTGEDDEPDAEPAGFRDWLETDPNAEFPFESGRYHLYIARSCPWAHGAVLARQLTGLDEHVTMDIMDPRLGNEGWKFSPDLDECTEESVNGFTHLRDVYVAANPTYTGRVTTPVLWDRTHETIVNNESIEIMRMFVAVAREYGNGVDLYPEGYRQTVDHIVESVDESINNGVYRAGFARTQSTYDEAVTDLFDAFDQWDDVLSEQRYLAGDRLTLADLRLFPTLIRFDQAYHTQFKCDRRFVHQYDNLWPYLRDLYQTPGVADTVNFDHIKMAYYPDEPEALGPDLDYDAAHGRDDLPGQRPDPLRA